MKFYTFGNESNPVILLLPGTCCHWKRNFEGVIGLLARDFHVVCASYDGFDETERTAFPVAGYLPPRYETRGVSGPLPGAVGGGGQQLLRGRA